ncbi:MAG: hypothetical protein GY909_12455 [Oligoflexia bacterium]|nr:hypothetical protein [Oligoflexia bacterium]
MSSSKKNSGQAVIEYLLIFGFMALIAVNLIRGLGGALGNSVGSLAYALTQELATGVCPRNCFYHGYKNQVD